MTLRRFIQAFARVPGADGALVVPTLHREQERLVTAIDGPSRLREYLLNLGKKTGKSLTLSLVGLWHLLADPLVQSERLIGIAASDAEQAGVVFTTCEQLVSRHPWLQSHIRVLRNEMIFEDRDGRVHRLRKLARDTAGLHGEPWTCVLRDELWSEPDHAMSEALIPTPTCPAPLLLYASYAPLHSMRRPGVPLHDLLVRAERQDPTLFYSYIGGRGEDASWTVCPWITQAWIDEQERIFAASPSRFQRVVLNLPVRGDGDGLLTLDEVRGLSDPTVPAVPVRQPGVRYVAAADLGLSNDHAALVILHCDPTGRVIVDVCETWIPAPGQPVSLLAIEDRIGEWHDALRLDRVVIDQWQAAMLTERLRQRGMRADTVGVEQTKLDKIITLTKTIATRNQLSISPTNTYLLEQLEAVRVLETRTPKRDLLKFAPSGTGPSASVHDDAVVALGLALLEVQQAIGRLTLPDFVCPYLAMGRDVGCYLFGPGNMRLPLGDPACERCPGHQFALTFWRQHGQGQSLREFTHAMHFAPNTQIINHRYQRAVNALGL